MNFVLADEVNRAPAKVQSAMLELMAERQVSIGGQTFPMPKPFIVIATQNPIESEGVYPLPEAQRDRFLVKIDVPHPRGHEEFEILRRMSVDPPEPRQVLKPETIMELQRVRRAGLRPQPGRGVRRTPGDGDPDTVRLPPARPGADHRARRQPPRDPGLIAAGRALALIHGRDYLLPSDVQTVALDVMGHRLGLTFDAVADNIDPRAVIERILATVPPPQPVWRDGADGTGRPEFV